jgi:hypothetical protein
VKLRTYVPFLSHVFAALVLSAFGCVFATAQAGPTAVRRIQPSAFVMVNGTFTGLESNGVTSFQGGRNLAFAAGGDFGFYAPGRYSLAAEVRGSIPMNSGDIVGEKSILGGLRFSREPAGDHALPIRPYVDILFGRGQLNYQNGGYVTPYFILLSNNSNTLEAGGGVEMDVARNFSVKLDAQVQTWKTPIPGVDTLYSKHAGVGVTYRLGAGSGPR